MFRSIVALIVLASVVLFANSATAGEYTYLQDARGQIYIAIQVLESTGGNWAGTRKRAIETLKGAMAEVDAALRFVGVTTYKEAPFIKGKGLDRLPQCVKVMREAREKLSNAGGGFGTHRMSAIRALDAAIRELETGIAKGPQPGKRGKVAR